MNKIKLYIILIITTLFIGLCTTIGIQNHKLNKAKNELELSEINYKALENECNKLTTDNIEYKLTVTQLSLSQDSLTSALNRVRINLGIKDKEIKRLGYIASQAQKTDTLYIRDSIFLNNSASDLGLGTGMIVSENGYVLTNWHVAGNKYSNCYITLENGKSYNGSVVWADSDLDLAIVKINATGLQYLKLGDSDNVKLGQTTFAIGNPIGVEFQRTVTSGIISGVNRTIKIEEENNAN